MRGAFPTRLTAALALLVLVLAACSSASSGPTNAAGNAAATEEIGDEEAVVEIEPGELQQSTEATADVSRPDPEAVVGSIVRIIGLGCGVPSIGTGFAVEDQVVVTNAHLVAGRDPETLAVQTEDGTEFGAELIAFDQDLDLALLRIPDATFEPLNLVTEVPIVDGVAIGIRTNDGVNIINEIEFTVDAPVIVNWDGVFRDTESRFRGLRMLADIRRGDSGSPLLINDQDVIGLVQSTTRNQPQGYAVGAEEIADFVTSIEDSDDADRVVIERCT